MSNKFNHLYEFGSFRLSLTDRILVRDGELVPLTPKAFETLLVLVQNSGHVVEKEELLKTVWPDTFVEEATLAQNIFTLRKALGKGEKDGPTYIETVPKRGYRFVAQVKELHPAITAHKNVAVEMLDLKTSYEEMDEVEEQVLARSIINPEKMAEDLAEDLSAASFPPTEEKADISIFNQTFKLINKEKSFPIWAVAILVVAVLVLSVAFLFIYRKTQSFLPFQAMQIELLPVPTTKAVDAAISPDGKYVTYIEKEGQDYTVWVKQLTTDSVARQIVAAEKGQVRRDSFFSPDGQFIYYHAFNLNSTNKATLYKVPFLGGNSQPIVTDVSSPVRFSPDGKSITYIRFKEDLGDVSVIVASADGGSEKSIISKKYPTGYLWPVWSPNGKVVTTAAVVPDRDSVAYSLVEIDIETGVERIVNPKKWAEISRIEWLSEDEGLVICARERELSQFQIWHVSYPEGTLKRVTNDLHSYLGLSKSADSKFLVSLQTESSTSIWVTEPGNPQKASPVSSATGKYDGFYGLAWTPNGRIVYSSAVGSAWEIWIMEPDGSHQKQLTVGGASNYGPSVSTDGRYIAFVSSRSGKGLNIWRMDIDGSNLKQLTFGSGENFPHFTPDGKWIVYASTGFEQEKAVWKVSVDGGTPIKLTDKLTSWPTVSPDGRFVACLYRDKPAENYKIAIYSIDGGVPVKLIDLPPSVSSHTPNTVWTPDSKYISLVENRQGTWNVSKLSIETGELEPVTEYKQSGISALDWSAKNGRIALTRTNETTQVVIIKDKR